MIPLQLPLGDAEHEAARRLLPDLERHLNLVSSASNLLSHVAAAVPAVLLASASQARKVTSALLSRLSNDLRCIGILALHGYSLEAAALASNAYETAYTAAAIAGDEDFASRWVLHDDPTRQFVPILEATKRALTNVGHPQVDAQSQIEYRVYRQLCMAKHANPLLQARFGLEEIQGNIVTVNGPDVSEDGVRVAWFALEHGVGCTLVAASVFIGAHVPREARAALQSEARQIGVMRKLLERAALNRWGNTDPFPGRWRDGARNP